VPSGAPIAKQLPPETDVNRPTIDPNTGQPTGGYEPAKLGNVPVQIPPGSRLAPGGLPGQFLPINRDPNSLPTNPRMLPGETPRAVNPGPIESPNSRVRSGFQDAYGNPPVARGPATQPPVGEPEAIKGELAESQRQANDLSAAANETRNTKALIGNLRNTLKGFTPGPLADYSRIGRSLAANVVPDSWKKEGGFLDPKSIASQEEFNKFAQQIAQSQFKQLGGTGTNAHLDSVQHTSPNEFMSKLGIQGVLGFLDGNQDAIEMKNKEWRNWRSKGNSVQTWPAFNQKFNETFDPRVFQLKYLAPKERREYVDSITTPDEAQSFVRAFHHAKTKGWINYEIPK
jgi:hypothetical protein